MNINGSNNLNQQKFLDPEAVIKQLGDMSSNKIADFGCGTGYFSIAIAKKIGDDGTVYALDILAQRLESVESQARIQGLNNIITKRVNVEKPGGSGLDDESVDWVVMKDVLFQNQDKGSMIVEAKRVLKKGGQMLIIEWNTNDDSIGPEKELRIAKTDLLSITEKAELELVKEVTVGDFHYGVVLAK